MIGDDQVIRSHLVVLATLAQYRASSASRHLLANQPLHESNRGIELDIFRQYRRQFDNICLYEHQPAQNNKLQDDGPAVYNIRLLSNHS